MGVNLSNIENDEVKPQCSSCGVGLCWSIDTIEYLEWSGFWDEWSCRDCNPRYNGAYEAYKKTHKPFEHLKKHLKL